VSLLGIAAARIFFGEGAPRIVITGAGHLHRDLQNPEFLGNAAGNATAILARLEASGLLASGKARQPLFGPPQVMAVENPATAVVLSGRPFALAADGSLLGPATPADAARAGVADLPVVRCGDPAAPGFPGCAQIGARLAATLLGHPELDRFVSEVDGSAGPVRVTVVLRPWPVSVVLTEERFAEELGTALRHIPDLLARWPNLEEVDARVGDRLLLRLAPESDEPTTFSKEEVIS